MSVRELWDKSITISLPDEFEKISELTNAPSNQEIFTRPETSTSVVLELLERVTPSTIRQDQSSNVSELVNRGKTDDEKALMFHFSDVVDLKDQVEVLRDVKVIEREDYAAYGMEASTISSGRQGPESILLVLGLVRYQSSLSGREINNDGTDILVCVNVKNYTTEHDGTERREVAIRLRDEIVKSLVVKNEGLFQS